MIKKISIQTDLAVLNIFLLSETSPILANDSKAFKDPLDSEKRAIFQKVSASPVAAMAYVSSSFATNPRVMTSTDMDRRLQAKFDELIIKTSLRTLLLLL